MKFKINVQCTGLPTIFFAKIFSSLPLNLWYTLSKAISADL